MNNFQSELIEAMRCHTLEDAAQKLKVSVFTLKRWMEGKSAPHPYGRSSVFAALK